MIAPSSLRLWLGACALACLPALCAPDARADQDGGPTGTAASETLLLQQPTISADHIVFVYAQDLWIVDRAGGTARRLTSDIGRESGPRLSPDGRWVAFTGEYQGNADVYVISVAGGAPRRLTWHPDGDSLRDWDPDGKHVLFASGRESGAPVRKLFRVALDGGMPTALAIPRVGHAAYNGKGDRIAYTPYGDAFRTWKRYRGGRVPPVWIYDPATHDVEQIPHGAASDTFPCWLGSDVYFASDRAGAKGVEQMNVWRYTPGSKQAPEQITFFDTFGVSDMSAGDGVLVMAVGGSLRVYDPRTKKLEPKHINVQTDGLGRLPEWKAVRGFVRDADLSPNGKRAVFEARGEIITVPREHGSPRNLTDSPGSHERSPAWSPDGEKIAWFSDASGEYELVVRDQKGRTAPSTWKLGGAQFYNDARWSPDGKHILFSDKGNRLAYLTFETSKVTEISRTQGTLGQLRPFGVWSKDSKWIAFEYRNPETAYDGVALYDVSSGETTRVTDGFSDADSPAFSLDGKYLFFRASVQSGPGLFGLDLSTSGLSRPTGSLYVAVLSKDTEDPLGPRSDEGFEKKKDKEKKGEKKDAKPDDDGKEDGKKDDAKPAEGSDDDGAGDDDPGDDDAGDDDAGDNEEGKDGDNEKQPEGKQAGDKDGEKKPAKSLVDIDGLTQRILALPLGQGFYYNLVCSSGKLLFIERPEGGKSELKAFDFKSRKENTVVAGATACKVSADGKTLLVQTGSNWQLVGENGKGGKSPRIDAVKVELDPSREWPQILRECWRIQRDFFYDPNMHGVDWDAMWTRWSAFLPHVQHRADLNLIMGEMMGELCCGHEYVGGGDYPTASGGIDVGLLGADLAVEDGRYRIEHIYEGQNWNPGTRAPLTAPGVAVAVGDYLISVNGRAIKGSDNPFEAFQATAGEPVELEVSSNADASESRTYTVVPLSSDSGLRRMAWIESNRKRVEELSGGKLAYIYMPNTAGAGLAAFNRDFYSQLDKQGVVLDERFNGGGKVADSIVNVLDRKVLCYWMNREGWLGRTPFGTMSGPKVMIANERAGSGGDAMPWMFKKMKIGTLVGTRTWGGLVGISGYPTLIDGGSCTAASFGIMDTDGTWVVENVGVAPDVEVIQWPKEVAAGHDPQLEKAVAIALEQLEMNPPEKRPAYTPPAAR